MKKFVTLVLVPLLPLLIVRSVFSEMREATWKEYRKPSKEKPTTYSGNLNIGSQFVRDVLGNERTGVSSMINLNLNRKIGKEGILQAGINVNNLRLTTGDNEQYGVNLSFKTPALEAKLSGSLSNSSNIISKVMHRSKLDLIKIDLRTTALENFPVSFNYSNFSNKNLQGDSTQQVLLTEQMGISIGSKIGKVQTDLGMDLGRISDPIRNSKTTAVGVKLNSVIPITKIFQLNLGIQPNITETLPNDILGKVSSEALNSTIGLNIQLFDNLKLMSSFGLNNSIHKSMDTETKTETFLQNYCLSYQPFDTLSININSNLSDVKNANKSHTINTNINYSPKEKKFFGPSTLGFQYTGARDKWGKVQSEGENLTLNTLFYPLEDMNFTTNFSRNVQKTFPLVGASAFNINTNLNLTLSHKIFQNLRYSLGYVLTTTETERPSYGTTNSYTGNINYELKKNIPISLQHIITFSNFDTKKINTQKSVVSIRIPVKESFATSYSFSIDRAETIELISTYTETIYHTIGLELHPKKIPIILNTNLSFVSSKNTNTQTISIIFNCPIIDKLSFNLNLNHNRTSNATATTAQTNLTTGLLYTF